MQVTVSSFQGTLCQYLGLRGRQHHLCRLESGVSGALAQAVAQAVVQCKHQFHYERWNCSMERRVHVIHRGRFGFHFCCLRQDEKMLLLDPGTVICQFLCVCPFLVSQEFGLHCCQERINLEGFGAFCVSKSDSFVWHFFTCKLAFPFAEPWQLLKNITVRCIGSFVVLADS